MDSFATVFPFAARALVALVVASWVSSCKSEPPACVAILATEDIHGAIEPHVLYSGDKALRYGGLEVLASYFQRVREQNPDRVLLVDGGDLYQGSLASNLSEGRAIVTAMNWLGYDAATLGNHEFDFGAGKAWRATPKEASPSMEERLAVVRARVAEAKFPFLAVNVLDRSTQAPIRWPNALPETIVVKGGVRIGIIGVATPETPRLTKPDNILSLEFAAPEPRIVESAKRLRTAGAQLVVLLAHVGGACTKVQNPEDLSSCDPDAELFAILRKLPPHTIDVAVGGHTHQQIAHWFENVATVQAGARGRSFAWVDACPLPEGGIDRKRSLIHPIVDACLDTWADGTCVARKSGGTVQQATFLGKPVEASAELAALMKPFNDQVAVEGARPIGVRLAEPLARETVDGDTPIGSALTEAMRRVTGAPLAMQNRGGLRGDLPAGDLTFGQIFEVIPFDNRVAELELTGAELRAVLGYMFEKRHSQPILAGLRVETSPQGLSITLADGKPLDDAAQYRLATNDFLATGGDGLNSVLKNVPAERLKIYDIELRQALIEYMREVGVEAKKASPRAQAQKGPGPRARKN